MSLAAIGMEEGIELHLHVRALILLIQLFLHPLQCLDGRHGNIQVQLHDVEPGDHHPATWMGVPELTIGCHHATHDADEGILDGDVAGRGGIGAEQQRGEGCLNLLRLR